MPWEHCGETILDDEKCPKCQMTKQQWTLEWNVTRTFSVSSGKSKLKIILQNADGEPIPDAAYVVTLADGKEIKGNVDAFGAARISATGGCTIKFPELKPEAWEKKKAAST